MGAGRGASPKATMLGWSLSGLLHGIILAAAGVSVHLSAPYPVPQNQPFRWNVSLSAAPRSEAVVSNGLQSSASASNPEARSPEAQDPQSLERTVDLPSVRHDEALQSKRSPLPSTEHRASHVPPVPPNTLADVHPRRQEAVMAVARPAASLVPQPEVESRRESDRVEVEAQPEHVTVLQRPQAVTHALVKRTILPDYGWLRETLRSRLEEVKRYPAAARAVHVQGLVLVQVRIDGDGRLTDPEIKETSGSAMLDRAALEAVQAASPLRLDHKLERAPLVMLVPLHYRLE